jgi:L-fuconolactonase
MRIDAHQHFWHYVPFEYPWIDDTLAPLRRDFLPKDLHPLLAATGIDGCVAVQARQNLEETAFLLDLADRNPYVLGVVGWVDLRGPMARDQIARFARHPRFVGVRHIVQGEPDDRFLLGRQFLDGVALLAEFDLAYDILIYPRHLPVAAEFVERFPSQRFVLDHLAKPEIRSGEIRSWERGLRRLAEHPNVMAKLSGLVTEADWARWTPEGLRPYLDAAFAAFGPDRLMIGSDWPVCTVAGEYGRVMGAVISYLEGRPGAEREAVLGGNAARLWKLRERQERPR